MLRWADYCGNAVPVSVPATAYKPPQTTHRQPRGKRKPLKNQGERLKIPGVFRARVPYESAALPPELHRHSSRLYQALSGCVKGRAACVVYQLNRKSVEP